MTNPSPSSRQPAAVLTFACPAAEQRGAEAEAVLTPAGAAARPAGLLTRLAGAQRYADGSQRRTYRYGVGTALEGLTAPDGGARAHVTRSDDTWHRAPSDVRERVLDAIRRDAQAQQATRP